MKRPVVLFDLDGTLTPPREPMPGIIRSSIIELQKHAYIGILTGSPYEYVMEQTSTLWDVDLDCSNISIMACNGTKRYLWEDSRYVLSDSNDMIAEITQKRFEDLVRSLIALQAKMVDQFKFPLTGNFISYRGSMINYCPIGRDSQISYRKEFEELDEKHRIREAIMANIKLKFEESGLDKVLTYALGGSTSIDIYPNGWDKTFALRNYREDNTIYFVGDRCQPGGNDYHIFKDPRVIGYETSGPLRTVEIIEEIIKLEKNK